MMYKVISFLCDIVTKHHETEKPQSQEVQVGSTGLFGRGFFFLPSCSTSLSDLADRQGFGLISCEAAAQSHSRNIQQAVPPTITYKRDPQF